MMSEDWYEKEIRLDLASSIEKGDLIVKSDGSWLEKILLDRFPFASNDIDWKNVPGSVERYEPAHDKESQSFIEFFRGLIEEHGLEGKVCYVGNGVADYSIEGSLESMVTGMNKILLIPQHHYFLASGGKWCASLRLSGHMTFGFSPR